jgi:hypothetical protein
MNGRFELPVHSQPTRNSELRQIVETLLLHITRERGAGVSPVDIVTGRAMAKAVSCWLPTVA